MAALLIACDDTSAPVDLAFPMHRGFEGGGPAALGGGVLIADRGCLFMQMDPPGDRMLVVWPEDFRLAQEEGGRVAVVGSGMAVPIGARMQVGGGAYQDWPWVEGRLTNGPLPAACMTPEIWIASGFVR